MTVHGLVREKRILVCVGPGGVGKTTTAAAAGTLGAAAGRRTLVCTIDPAPRLADAMGMGPLGSDPREMPADQARALGIARDGLLWAVRLDTRRAFAALVEEQVTDPEMRRRIFTNTIYRQITTTLTGSQEYAATLALHRLAARGEWDLIVLDTPPTAHALDFLEAPKRIREAIASPAVRWLAGSGEPEEGGFSLRALRSGSALLAKRLAKLTGSKFLDDVAAFFVDFRQVLDGFLSRALEIEALLRRPEVAFLLVLAPELPAVDEALYFHARLRDAAIPLQAFVVNRVHALPGLVDAAALADGLRRHPALAAMAPAAIEKTAERLARTVLDHGRLRTSERQQIERLSRSAPGVPIIEVPLLDHDVASLAALRAVGEHLRT